MYNLTQCKVFQDFIEDVLAGAFSPFSLTCPILCFLMLPFSLYFSHPPGSLIPWCLSQLRFCHGRSVSHFQPLSGWNLVMTPPLGEDAKNNDGTSWSWQVALTSPLSCRREPCRARVCEANCSSGHRWQWISPSLGHIHWRPTLTSPARTPSRSPGLLQPAREKGFQVKIYVAGLASSPYRSGSLECLPLPNYAAMTHSICYHIPYVNLAFMPSAVTRYSSPAFPPFFPLLWCLSEEVIQACNTVPAPTSNWLPLLTLPPSFADPTTFTVVSGRPLMCRS